MDRKYSRLLCRAIPNSSITCPPSPAIMHLRRVRFSNGATNLHWVRLYMAQYVPLTHFYLSSTLTILEERPMFEGLFQPLHLIVIFLVALVVFGPKRLPDSERDSGKRSVDSRKRLKGTNWITNNLKVMRMRKDDRVMAPVCFNTQSIVTCCDRSPTFNIFLLPNQ